MNTLVRDVMTTSVTWIRQGTPYREMAAALRTHQVSAFPVLDEYETVIGIVSEADMLNKPARHVQGVVAVRDRLSYPLGGPVDVPSPCTTADARPAASRGSR